MNQELAKQQDLITTAFGSSPQQIHSCPFQSSTISHSLVFRFVQEITQQQFYEAFSLYIETQNCRRVQVGKGLWRSCDPTLLLKQGHMLARLVDRKDWALYSLWSDSCLKEKKLTLNLFCNVNENLISRCLIQINPWKNFHYIPREWVQIPGKIWGIWA